MARLYFLTSNPYKFQEYARCFSQAGVSVDHWIGDLTEVQDVDMRTMAHQKVLDGYRRILHPVVIDVSGMRLAALNGLPGGLNRQFWEILHSSVCDVVQKVGDATATMVVNLALCDGRRTYFGCGEVMGRIAPSESPVGTFHLDRVFIPAGESVVLSEMPCEDRDMKGPRAMAVNNLLSVIRSTRFGKQIGIR